MPAVVTGRYDAHASDMNTHDDNADVRTALSILNGAVTRLEEECRAIPKMALAVEYITTAVDKLDRLVEAIRDPRMREIEKEIGDLKGRAAAVERTIAGPPELRTQVTTDAERLSRLEKLVYGALATSAAAIIGIILTTVLKLGAR